MGERRTTDRRRQDRRSPTPVWRRPWALVVYGAAGTLLVIALVNRSRPPEVVIGANDVVIRHGAQPAPISRADQSGIKPEDARGAAHLERLIAEGEAARGRYVQAELYCSSITRVSLRSVQAIEPAVAQVRDEANRVPAAECKWGTGTGDEPRGDVLLIVPADMTASFSAAPIVDDGFVSRRRVVAVVEWIGRSDALALRNAVVLREFPGAPTAMANHPVASG